MDVSVIIVNYNTKDLTQKCIDSVFLHTSGVKFEVVLIDNCSSDGSVDQFQDDHRILFIKSSVNLGFGKANNLGYEHCRGKYVFLLNSDTLLLNNAIKLFFDKMESVSPQVGCMGCILKNTENDDIHSYADFPKVSNALYTFVSPKLFGMFGYHNMKMDAPERREKDSSFFKVDYVTGADLFIRRNVIEECGLFDPAFFMYYEDPELQYRYQVRGYSSYIYDAPQIVHLEGCSSDPRSLRKKGIIKMGSLMTYFSKTENWWKVLILRLLLLLKSPYLLLRYKYSLDDGVSYLKTIVL